jgi:hypothetical protein
MNPVKLAVMLVASALALCAAIAAAKENYKEKAFNADTRARFEEVAANVRQEMETGGRYEYVSTSERKTIDRKLSEMESLFKDSDSVESMKQDTKIKLFNAQEVVNSILTRRDRDRVICKNEAPLGSHIPVTTCHTYGQEEDARRETRKQLDDWGRPLCVGDCGGR